MTLTAEEGRDIVFNKSNDWEEVYQKVYDTSRWSTMKEGVFKHIPTGKYYELDWQVGSTESQDEGPFEYVDEVIASEVEEINVVTTKWVAVVKP